MNKVWRVKIGDGYTSYEVFALTAQYAIKRALTLATRDRVDSDQKWVSGVELIAQPE